VSRLTNRSGAVPGLEQRGVDVREAGLAGERVDAVDHAGWARGLGDVDDVDGGVGRRPGRALDVERAAARGQRFLADGVVVAATLGSWP